MNRMNRRYMYIITAALLLTAVTASGCAAFESFVEKVQGSLLGDDFKILSYDDYGNNVITAQGRNINIGIYKNAANDNPENSGFESEVLEITIEGKQLLHVGSTMVFAEEGIDMIEDFDVEYLKDASTSGQGTLVPIDRTINHFMNLIGKKKTIVIRSQLGIVIGVYQGDKVLVEVPDDLPKMTRLVVDGKSLYIHRADYDIFDTGLFKQ
ncbi:MAG: DUF5052 family protein [Bacillota bacterium]